MKLIEPEFQHFMLIVFQSCFGSFIFAFTHQLFVSVAVEVLVAFCLCIQSHSEGFGGSASAHTN